MITNDDKNQCLFLVFLILEELQIDFKDSLEQSHVGTLIKTDLMLPQVENDDFTGSH